MGFVAEDSRCASGVSYTRKRLIYILPRQDQRLQSEIYFRMFAP
jgi:hypothetical protein